MELHPQVKKLVDECLSQASDMDRDELLSMILALGIVRLNVVQLESPARAIDSDLLGQVLDADMAALDALQRERLASVGIAGVILPARR